MEEKEAIWKVPACHLSFIWVLSILRLGDFGLQIMIVIMLARGEYMLTLSGTLIWLAVAQVSGCLAVAAAILLAFHFDTLCMYIWFKFYDIM